MVSLMQSVPRRGWSAAIERAKRHAGAAPAAFRARPFLLGLILVSTVMNLLMLLTVVSVLKALHWATQNYSVNVFAGLLVIVVLGYVFYALLQLTRMRILLALRRRLRSGL